MRTRSIVLVWLITAIIVILIDLPKGGQEDSEVNCNMINRDFDILLRSDDADLITKKSHLSIDPAYYLSYRLSEDYADTLYDLVLTDTTWKKATEFGDLVSTYISPEISIFEELSAMEKACFKENTYIKVLVNTSGKNDDYVSSYSFIAFDADANELYYFKLNY